MAVNTERVKLSGMSFDLSRRRYLIAVAGGATLAGCLDSDGGHRDGNHRDGNYRDGGHSDGNYRDGGHSDGDRTLSVTSAEQYSSPGCECCHRYATYVQGHLDTSLSENTPSDITAVKRRHGVPSELRSCHTLVLDDYVVEGHVPADVVATVLDERPRIDGVALPGMPAGSPGMGGTKDGAFRIHAFDGGRADGVYDTR